MRKQFWYTPVTYSSFCWTFLAGFLGFCASFLIHRASRCPSHPVSQYPWEILRTSPGGLQPSLHSTQQTAGVWAGLLPQPTAVMANLLKFSVMQVSCCSTHAIGSHHWSRGSAPTVYCWSCFNKQVYSYTCFAPPLYYYVIKPLWLSKHSYWSSKYFIIKTKCSKYCRSKITKPKDLIKCFKGKKTHLKAHCKTSSSLSHVSYHH